MDNKCSKYESLFIFSDEETLKKHLEECEECRIEYEKQQKVSSLLDEVKMYYHSKNRRRSRIQAACIAIFMMFSTLSLGLAITNDDLMDEIRYGETLTAEDLGFPVDSYGLLTVDDE